jgi:hypothetical protein
MEMAQDRTQRQQTGFFIKCVYTSRSALAGAVQKQEQKILREVTWDS